MKIDYDLKIQYAYTNLFVDKDLYTTAVKSVMAVCHLVFEFELKVF